LGQQDAQDYNDKMDELDRRARENLENREFEKGRSAAGGAVTTEGADEMLRSVGIEPAEEELEEENESDSMERVNEMLYAVGNNGHAEKFDSILGEEPSIGTKQRHSELGIAEYEGGMQFLTDDGRTVKKAAYRLMEETDLDVGKVAASLSMTKLANDPSTKLEMYQEIQMNEYDTQRDLGEEIGMDASNVSKYLSEWEDQGLVDKDSLELTDDGYEVAQTLRGLEAYNEHK